MKTTEFTLGPFVNEFEKTFAKYIGVKYCISTNNGTDALILCLKSLNIGKGDEVITVCNSFYATVGAIVACGATPVLVDCDERYQINIKKIEKNLKKNKSHSSSTLGGASPDMSQIMALSKNTKLKLLRTHVWALELKSMVSLPEVLE